MKFTEFCQQNNIQLLRDDKKFLVSMLHSIPDERRMNLLKNYANEWLKGMDEEICSPLKQNTGRKRANSYIREEISIK